MKLSDAKILLVDDEPMLLEIFSLWLTNGKGSSLLSTAADGQQALAMATETSYDLLITDLKMPRMDGISLMRHLAESRRTPPSIIFVSGFGNVDEREMYGLGVEAFLSKPMTRETLISVGEAVLAPRYSLWINRFDVPPRQSILIEASDFSERAHDGGIVLGRGGFSARYVGPVAPGKVSFDCHLASDGSRMTGEGFIRWRSKTEGTLGIEFSFLEESCRAEIAERITNTIPRAFIPAL